MIVTLITDFGSGEYVGAMKGVIYSNCPDVKIVDITHDIEKFNVRNAAASVFASCPHFPEGSVHLVVVDPGVGTERRGVIIKTKSHYYVGPDNGVFSLLADVQKVYEIRSESKSKTFHGRDVFAPIAAKLACSESPSEFGEETSNIKRIIKKPKIKNGVIEGEVIAVDAFGNIITNITDVGRIGYGDAVKLQINDETKKIKFVESYGFAKKGELVCLIGSSGLLEVAVREGDAGKLLDVKSGETIVIR
ncbi:MAG: SAM-dependent chlorinase/fluorinase [Candidatus Hydrothermarchaeaceae archaeon]